MNTPTATEVYSATKAILVDIDSTIADCHHRLVHITNGSRNWGGFWKDLHLDGPIEHIITLVRAMSDHGVAIFILTARDEHVRDRTAAWLDQHSIPYDRMYMRADKDFRADYIVKKEITDRIKAEGYNILFALEDRDHNVAMFRENGVPCLQVVEDKEKRYERDWAGATCLTLLIGPSGCGKSTYANTHFDPSEIVSSDEIREALTPWKRTDSEGTWPLLTPADHTRTWAAVHDLINTRTRNGLRTALDATNIVRRDRMAAIKGVPNTQRIEYVILDRPLTDKIVSRGWRSENLVRKHHDTFQASLKHALRGDDLDYVDVKDKRNWITST